AALFTETYGNAVMRALTRASKSFLQDPPAGFASASLLTPRGTLLVAAPQDLVKLGAIEEECRALVANLVRLDSAAVRERVPCFTAAQVAGGLLEPDAMDIDVHALHQGFLRRMSARGGTLVRGAGVVALERDAGRWRIETPTQAYTADHVVNAAGAWADVVGKLAGARSIGLVPKRRTAITFDAPGATDVHRWPAVIEVNESWYFKPDAGRILASPADETPSPPCDAQPDDYDIAVLVARLTEATTLTVPRIRSRWAGLRSFVVDKTIVAGFDPQVPQFFWLAGQGGYGIQTAAAVARTAAALVLDHALPADIEDLGVSRAALAPDRQSLHG
ncbi:MAG TPA: FAD-binding oxidoreductase, partial [Burkholderiaceae bacterium]|nr:FAD-binding oxidoreductase [Burkholderiaceae bacterium]